MEAELMGAVAQFGAAGLIGWMWLSERRSSAERERQIDETHRRIMDQGQDRAALIEIVRDSTRAMVALEGGQRSLVALIERSSFRQGGTEQGEGKGAA